MAMRPPNALIAVMLAGCTAPDSPQSDVSPETAFDRSSKRNPPRVTLREATELLRRQLAPGEELVEPTVGEPSRSGHLVLRGVAKTESSARVIAAWEDGVPQPAVVLDMVGEATNRRRLGKLSDTVLAVAEQNFSAEVDIAFDAPAVQPLDLSKYAGTGIHPTDAAARERERIRGELHAARAELARYLIASGAADIIEMENLPLIRARVPSQVLLSRSFNERTDVLIVDIVDRSELSLYGYAGHGALGGVFLRDGNCGMDHCDGFGLGVAIWEGRSGLGFYGLLALTNTRFWAHTHTWQYAPTPCTTDSQCPLFSGFAGFCRNNQCQNEHSSLVAASVGMIGAFTQQGYLFPRAGAYRVNYKYANTANVEGLDWALTQNVLYLNRSQAVPGQPEPYRPARRTIDWGVRNQSLTFAMAVGNNAASQADCGGWNTLCVGMADYRTWANRTDDVVAADSTWRNNQYFSYTERPHVVAMGGSALQLPNVCRTDNAMSDRSCVFGASLMNRGTSFSAPAVLGAALMTHQFAGWFFDFGKPAMRKIALMVSASDANGDGPIPVPGIDGKDGAGMPNLDRIYWMVTLGWYRTAFVRPEHFANNAAVWVADMTFVGRTDGGLEALRIGMAWNSCATQGPTGTNTLPDFDLYVTKPAACGGTTISATRTATEFEMLYDQCLPPGVAGTYRIYIRKKVGTAFSLCGIEEDEPISVAWDAVWL